MVEWIILLVVACTVCRVARLNCPLRIAALAGFIFGAIAEACGSGLTISVRTTTEWALAGFLVTALLFRREIQRLLR